MTPSADTSAIESRALTLPEQASAHLVNDQVTLDAAGAFLTNVIIPMRKEADSVFDPIIAVAHKSHATAIAGKRKVTDPIMQAESTMRRLINEFLAGQKRLTDEEAARKRQDAEELDRIESARLTRDHEELIEAKLQAADRDLADAPEFVRQSVTREILSTPAPKSDPVMTAPIIMQPSYTAPKGINTRETWDVEVTDLKALLASIVAGKNPASLIEPNMAVLKKLATALKDQFNVPGCRAFKNDGIAARGSR